MIRTQTGLSFSNAPHLSPVLCCGALETWPRSQYSPRPPEFALKKARIQFLTKKPTYPGSGQYQGSPKRRSIDCFRTAERAFFGFLKALAQLLLTAPKLTVWMIFYISKKRRHTRAPTLEK